MNKRAFLLCLFVLGTGVAFSQDAEIKKSKRLIDVDHAAEAMAPIEAAIKQYPEEANLYYYLGYAQLKNNQLDAAAKSFDAGIKLDPKEAINYAGKGHLSMLQNRPADAKVNLDKALEMTKSKKAPVLKAVAEAYLTNVKFAGDAVALLLKAKGIKDDAETELLLGDAYLLQNQGGSAVSAYENAASMDGKNGKPHYKIGLIYVRSNPQLSQQSFEKAVAVDPEYTYAYDELADIYYQQKEADKAVAAAEKFRALSSDPEKIKMRLAFIYAMKAEYAKANELFKELITKENVKPIVYRYYFKSLQATKVSADSVEATKVGEQFLVKAKPEDITPKDYIELGKLYIALGDEDKGVANLEKAVRLDPKSPEAMQIQAETLFKGRKYCDAAIAYRRLVATKTKPGPNDFLSLGRSYTRCEKYLEADTVYNKLVEQYPTNLPVVVEAGRVKTNIDSTYKTGYAKPLYDKVLELTATSTDKNKNTYMIEAYRYMASYYAINQDNINKAKEYIEKILSVDPNDKQAQAALKAIKDGQAQQLQQQKKPGK